MTGAIKLIITGHRGNIGARLFEYYRGRGFDVIGIDKRDGADFDIAVPEGRWVHCLSGASAIIHLAAIADENASEDVVQSNNVRATSNLLASAIAAGVPRMVLASSTWTAPALYGNPVGSVKPVNAYGRSKVIGEVMLREAAAAGLIAGVSVRIGAVTPEGANTKGIPDWIKSILCSDEDLRRDFDAALAPSSGYRMIEMVRKIADHC